jgi:tRNA threonylcarbamoyladenosine biosynthesis protein TsaB
MQTSDLQAIAVVQGPGSFTGLRVGIATAKVMAYALGIPLVAVDTLDVIADQIASDPQVRAGGFDLIATIDAFRGQCFWAKYQISEGVVAKTTQTLIDDNGYLAGEIARWPDTGKLVVAGPSMAKLQESFQESLQGAASTNGAHQRLVWAQCMPQAASVAKLGWRALVAGHRADVFGLLPNYYRSSAAEEKRSG